MELFCCKIQMDIAQVPKWAPLKGHTGTVTSVAFTPDGRTLASGSGDMTIMLWDVATGQPKGAPLKGHTPNVVCLPQFFA